MGGWMLVVLLRLSNISTNPKNTNYILEHIRDFMERNDWFVIVVLLVVALFITTAIGLFVTDSSKNAILTKGKEFEDTPMTEDTKWGPGITSDLAILNNNGDQLLYIIEGSRDAGIYDLDNGSNTILQPAPENSFPAWDIIQGNFVYFFDGECMDVTDHSNTYECDYFLNRNDFGGRVPYVHTDSVFCKAHKEEVHQSDNNGYCSSNDRWSQQFGIYFMITSHSGNSSFSTSYVTFDEHWLGSDDIDMLMDFTNNLNWKIEYNNSTYDSGISYLESSIRLLGNEDPDLVNIKWIPKSENLMVLFENKVSIFSLDDDDGWVEKDSIGVGCDVDIFDEGAFDNNQIRKLWTTNLQNEHYGFIVSENGNYIIVYDECGDLYRLELDESKLNSEITKSATFDSGGTVYILSLIFIIICIYISTHDKNLKRKKSYQINANIICCIVLLTLVPGCLFDDENLYSMNLDKPENVNIQPQPFSEEIIATISFEEEVYLKALDYYFWDGNNHHWGSGGDGKSKSLDIPGHCSVDDCLSSLKLFWTGNELTP